MEKSSIKSKIDRVSRIVQPIYDLAVISMSGWVSYILVGIALKGTPTIVLWGGYLFTGSFVNWVWEARKHAHNS